MTSLFAAKVLTYHPDEAEDVPPETAILVKVLSDGLRIVLGTDDVHDYEAPDVLIERRTNGWAIFLHPIGGSDPSGYIYMLDDGRSFVEPQDGCPTPAIAVVGDTPPELDRRDDATPSGPGT